MQVTMSRPDSSESPSNLDSLTKAQIRDLARSYPVLAPGVHGDVVIRASQKTMFINVIASAKPGQGRVGKYLDDLPLDFTIIVPSVLSQRFAGMLARRGFVSKTTEGMWIKKPAP
jgi:hypothetical protein